MINRCLPITSYSKITTDTLTSICTIQSLTKHHILTIHTVILPSFQRSEAYTWPYNRTSMVPSNCALKACSWSLHQNPDIILPEWRLNPVLSAIQADSCNHSATMLIWWQYFTYALHLSYMCPTGRTNSIPTVAYVIFSPYLQHMILLLGSGAIHQFIKTQEPKYNAHDYIWILI